MKLVLRYELDCSAERFWSLYFDQEYTTRLHTEALGSTSIEVTEQQGDVAHGVTRTLRYGQRPDMPGPVRKIFGDEIVSTEQSTFDPSTNISTFQLTPGTMADKTHINGSIKIEDHGDRISETFELEAKVKIFGVGPVVERFIEHQARQTQGKADTYMRAELAKS